MSKSINHFSVEGIFWVAFKQHLTSFGLKKRLDKKIHFTIGYHEKRSDINFHITKNAKDQKDKPKIEIVSIEKEIFEEFLSSLPSVLLHTMYEPFDLERLKIENDDGLWFLPYEAMDDDLGEKEFMKSIKGKYRLKGQTKIKVQKDVAGIIEEFATSKEIQKHIENSIVKLSKEVEGRVNGGVIISADRLYHFIKRENQYFVFRNNFKSLDLLHAIVSPQLVKQILFKIKRTLVLMKKAEIYSDVKAYNKPLKLGIRKGVVCLV